MFTVDVRLTVDEAIALMRAVAAKQWTEPDSDKREDLELIRLKLYDRIYEDHPETIGIDRGCRADQRRRPGMPDPQRYASGLRVCA